MRRLVDRAMLSAVLGPMVGKDPSPAANLSELKNGSVLPVTASTRHNLPSLTWRKCLPSSSQVMPPIGEPNSLGGWGESRVASVIGLSAPRASGKGRAGPDVVGTGAISRTTGKSFPSSRTESKKFQVAKPSSDWGSRRHAAKE